MTLGNNVSVKGYGQVYGNALINNGTINANVAAQGLVAAQTLTINPTSFTNSGNGKFGASGGTLTVQPTTFSNAGGVGSIFESAGKFSTCLMRSSVSSTRRRSSVTGP